MNPLDYKLFLACQRGDLTAVKDAVEKGANVNMRLGMDADGDEPNAPLLAAAANGHTAVVKYLLDHKDIISGVVTRFGLNALHLAARDGHTETVALLLDRGFGINAGSRSALHMAALRSRIETAKYLLSRGANIDQPTTEDWSDGQTPLFYAAFQGKDEMARFLIKHGANVNYVDANGDTPLFDACSSSILSVVKVLVEEGGANIHHMNRNGDTPFDKADSSEFADLAIYLWKAGAESKRIPKAPYILDWMRPYVVNRPSKRSYANAVVVGDTIYCVGGYGVPPIAPSNPTANIEAPHEHHVDGEYVVEEDEEEVEVVAEFEDEDDENADDADDDYEWAPNNGQQEAENYIWFPDFMQCKLELQEQSLLELLNLPAPQNHASQRLNALNPKRMHPLLQLVSPFTVKYIGSELDWAGCIQAKKPFKRTDLFNYFEIIITKAGVRREVVIGLTDKNYSLDALPGWHLESVGYHGDTGAVFWNKSGDEYDVGFGPQVRDGDVLGLGIIWTTNEVFLTHNGKFLGVAWTGVPATTTEYYPSIGLRTAGSEITINFGAKPFVFDFFADVLRFEKLSRDLSIPCSLLHVLPQTQNPNLSPFAGNMFCASFSKLTIITENGDMAEFPVIGPARQLGNPSTWCIGKKLYMLTNVDNPAQLHVLDLDKEVLEWDVIDLALPPKVRWAAQSQALCTLGTKILFFDAKECAFIFDTETNELSQIEATGPMNIKRGFAHVTLNDNEILVHSGYHSTLSGDSFVFNLETKEWRIVRHAGCRPMPKMNSTAVRIGDKILFIGGWRRGTPVDDIEIARITTRRDTTEKKVGAADLFLSIDLADVEFVHEDGKDTLCAHKIILAARSSVLRAVLEGTSHDLLRLSRGGSEGRDRIVVSKSLSWHLFSSMIQYLYTDSVNVHLDSSKLRQFIDMCEQLTPEHAMRIAESLILSRIYTLSSYYRDISWALQKEVYADIRFKTSEGIVPAHKAIICSECKYYRALLLGNLKESQMDVIEVTDMSHKAFMAILKYMYSHQVEISEIEDEIIDVLLIANKYGIESLSDYLESIVAANIQDDNVDSLTQLADAYNFTIIKSGCAAFRQGKLLQ